MTTRTDRNHSTKLEFPTNSEPGYILKSPRCLRGLHSTLQIKVSTFTYTTAQAAASFFVFSKTHKNFLLHREQRCSSEVLPAYHAQGSTPSNLKQHSSSLPISMSCWAQSHSRILYISYRVTKECILSLAKFPSIIVDIHLYLCIATRIPLPASAGIDRCFTSLEYFVYATDQSPCQYALCH